MTFGTAKEPQSTDKTAADHHPQRGKREPPNRRNLCRRHSELPATDAGLAHAAGADFQGGFEAEPEAYPGLRKTSRSNAASSSSRWEHDSQVRLRAGRQGSSTGQMAKATPSCTRKSRQRGSFRRGFGADRMYAVEKVRCAGCTSFPFHCCGAGGHRDRERLLSGRRRLFERVGIPRGRHRAPPRGPPHRIKD